MKQEIRWFLLFGLHRSGSSATAGVIHFLGADMGQNEGLFENLNFVLINDEMLWSIGKSWNNPPRDGKLTPDPKLNQRMEHFLSSCRSPVQGLKDPRLLLTFDGWRPYFQNLKNVTYIFIHRPFMSSVHSLAFRDQISLDQSADILGPYLQSFYRHRYALEEKGFDVLDIDYNDLVVDAKPFVEQINRRLGVPAEHNLDQVQRWIGKGYRRF